MRIKTNQTKQRKTCIVSQDVKKEEIMKLMSGFTNRIKILKSMKQKIDT